MKGSKFVDTNVLIRVWEAKPEFVKWLTELSDDQETVKIPSVVVAEVIWVLTSFYKKSRSEVKDFVNTIKNTDCFKVVTKHDIYKAVELYENTNIKFTDCMIAGYLDVGDVIISEDKDFDKLPGVRRVDVLTHQS